MSEWGGYFRTSDDAFPRPLLAGAAGPLPWRPWILLALLAACLIPRAQVAWNSDLLWGDTLLYHRDAQLLIRHDVPKAFAEFGPNVYVVILAALEQLGADWQTSAKWWSVAMATLTVLPLWGLFRRQFDDRIAVAACLAYAFHGKLVTIAPLILRDPTFWLLFAATLYAMWRAVVEIRVRWALAAGVLLTLAIHTRVEGWLLVVPLLGWSAGRMRAARGDRLRLAVGTAACLIIIPLSSAALTVGGLNEFRSPGVPSRLIEIFREYVRELAKPEPSPVDEPTAPSPTPGKAAPTIAKLTDEVDAPSPNWSATTFNRKLAIRWIKGHTYIGALLTLLGILLHWRGFMRREHLTLLAMNLILLAMIRVRYVRAGIDIRYFMPIVIISLPWIALGFFGCVRGVLRVLGYLLRWTPARCRTAVAIVTTLAIVASLADGKLAWRQMERQAALGLWIRDGLGPDRQIGGFFHGLNMVSYYAEGRVVGYFDPRLRGPEKTLPKVESLHADVLLVALDEEDGQVAFVMPPRIEARLGYRRVRGVGPAARLRSGGRARPQGDRLAAASACGRSERCCPIPPPPALVLDDTCRGYGPGRVSRPGMRTSGLRLVPHDTSIPIWSGNRLMIRPCNDSDFNAILSIINDAAEAYRGMIPADRWHDPYMPQQELHQEIRSGVRFWGWEEDGRLVGVMGIQDVQDVTLIRHAYVRTAERNLGIGGKLLCELRTLTARPVLMGTWAAAAWAVRFYQKHGFRLVTPEEKDRLLKKYWSIPDRQVETSVVLGDERWFASLQVNPPNRR